MIVEPSLSIYEQVFKNLPLGLIIFDENFKICAWNMWLAERTEITENEVLGKKIKEVFPDIECERFDWALEQVLKYGCPQVMSQILNSYVIPIKLSSEFGHGIDMMQQHIEMLPIKNENKRFALVSIDDVTHVVKQKNTLMEMAMKLESDSNHDALTNIYNRRYLWEALENQIQIATRDNQSIICCMYDLDYFKRVNDKYGHDMGDRLLIEFVELVKKTLRSSDIFVRYGGEEFITIMPNTKAEFACKQYERVQASLGESQFIREQIGAVTCSAGIAIWHLDDKIDAKTLVDRADKALYHAKNSGRNQIFIYVD